MNEIEYIGKCLLITTTFNESSRSQKGRAERVLVIGDLHLGYVGSMREAGYLVPGEMYKDIIGELDEVFRYIKKNNEKRLNKNVKDKKFNSNDNELIKNDNNLDEISDNNINRMLGRDRFGKKLEKAEEVDWVKIVEKVVLLGDLKHEFGTVLKEEWKEVLDFIDYLRDKCDEIIVVRGNHDAIIDNVLKQKGNVSVNYYLWNGFAFLHGDKDFPEIHGGDIKTWVIGHGHPAVVLEENIGVKKEKYKCFLDGKFRGKKVIMLPSFFPLNEGTDVRSYDLNLAWDFKLNSFNVRIVGEENLEVLDFGKLKRI